MHLKYAIHWMRRMKRRPRCLTPMSFAGLLCAATLSVAEPPAPADLILTHGHIHTGTAAQPWAEAVAGAQGRIIAVGTNAQAEAVAGAQTRRVDLQGQFAMAGLIDDHVHPVMGGLKLLYECNFPFSSGPEDVARAVGRCAASAPPGAWIRGGQWDSGFFDTHPLDEPRRLLDAVSGDHPVMLVDDSEHNGWVNSRALQLAGIDAGTADPPGGRIVRDAAGSPNGVLLESAFRGGARGGAPRQCRRHHGLQGRRGLRGVPRRLQRRGRGGRPDAARRGVPAHTVGITVGRSRLRRAEFLAQAESAREQMLQTGEGYDADCVHQYIRERLAGGKPSRPQPVKWRG